MSATLAARAAAAALCAIAAAGLTGPTPATAAAEPVRSPAVARSDTGPIVRDHRRNLRATLELTGRDGPRRYVIVSGLLPMTRAQAEAQIRGGAYVEAQLWGSDHNDTSDDDRLRTLPRAGLVAAADGLRFRAEAWCGKELDEDKPSWFDGFSGGEAGKRLADMDELYATARSHPAPAGQGPIPGRKFITAKVHGWFGHA